MVQQGKHTRPGLMEMVKGKGRVCDNHTDDKRVVEIRVLPQYAWLQSPAK